MAHTGVPVLIPIPLAALGTLTVADAEDFVTMMFDGVIWRVSCNVSSTGTTSGNTDFVIARTDAATSTTADLWTPASGIGRIAYNASTVYQEWDWESTGWTGYASGQLYPPTGTRLKKGDTLSLNVDVIPGGSDSADLRVTLWVKPLAAD